LIILNLNNRRFLNAESGNLTMDNYEVAPDILKNLPCGIFSKIESRCTLGILGNQNFMNLFKYISDIIFKTVFLHLKSEV